MVTGLTTALLAVAACTEEAPTGLELVAEPSAAVVAASAVTDLAVVTTGDSTVTLRWTEVDDGLGNPASYRVKYAPPAIDWKTATIGCDPTIPGTTIGAQASCVVEGLSSGTAYDFQLMSYRTLNGAWQGAVYSNVATGQTTVPGPTSGAGVTDLSVDAVTDSSFTVGWTQVDDGTGQPARYRVKFAAPPIDWSTATVGCNVGGTQIGGAASCTITGLSASSDYEVQLMSYRMVNGVWEGALYSNVAAGRTADAPAAGLPLTSSGGGIWMSRAQIAAIPMSGSAWNNLLSQANSSCGSVDLADQEDPTNVCVLAKALVFARTGDARYRTDVVTALTQIVQAPVYNGRALALGRELAAYVIAADLIDLRGHNPLLDGLFRTAIRALLVAPTTEAGTLQQCHERRPNNWGTHCGASRAAVAAYLGDTAELDRVAQVFRGWLGERSAYAGFSYGDLSWQCDPSRPVGINPAGCTRNGQSIDGVLPDDQRRGGGFTWPAPRENYVWEALQGALGQAVILDQAGYGVWEWGDRALLRAVRWLHNVNGYPADGDDQWQPYIVNRFYGSSFPVTTPARAGKNLGWTDWTHR